MGQHSPASATAMIVTSPRRSDAIGTALRDAYTREPLVPADMLALLCVLNGIAPVTAPRAEPY